MILHLYAKLWSPIKALVLLFVFILASLFVIAVSHQISHKNFRRKFKCRWAIFLKLWTVLCIWYSFVCFEGRSFNKLLFSFVGCRFYIQYASNQVLWNVTKVCVKVSACFYACWFIYSKCDCINLLCACLSLLCNYL